LVLVPVRIVMLGHIQTHLHLPVRTVLREDSVEAVLHRALVVKSTTMHQQKGRPLVPLVVMDSQASQLPPVAT
jgi:hypothetical protein